MRKWLLAVLVVMLAAGAWWFWDFVPATGWVGGFTLKLQLVSDSPIRSVRYKLFSSKREADLVLCTMQPCDLAGTKEISGPSAAAPIEVRIITSGTYASSGRDIARCQDEGLLLMVTFDDGNAVNRVVEIPDGRVTRELLVTLP